jgi:hypothetical protein
VLYERISGIAQGLRYQLTQLQGVFRFIPGHATYLPPFRGRAAAVFRPLPPIEDAKGDSSRSAGEGVIRLVQDIGGGGGEFCRTAVQRQPYG